MRRTDEPGDRRERCPFCYPASVSPRQLLATSEHFYLLAPAGQLVEGFLGVFTHVCSDAPIRLRCLDDMPVSWASELDSMEQMIRRFYSCSYGAPPLFYEHGRGGGGDSCLPGGDFVFHPHLCALPGPLEVHAALRRRLHRRPAPPWGSIRDEIGRQPYLYVHTEYGDDTPEPTVYFPTDEVGRRFLVDLSLKRLLAQGNSLPAAADWREHPGLSAIDAVAGRFDDFYVRAFRRPSDTWLGGGPAS